MANTKCSWMVRPSSTVELSQHSASCQPDERLSRLFAPVSHRSGYSVSARSHTHSRTPPNERCSRQALFGCGFAAMVILCLQLN